MKQWQAKRNAQDRKLYLSGSAVTKWEQGQGKSEADLYENIPRHFAFDCYEEDEPQKLKLDKMVKRKIMFSFSIMLLLAFITSVIVLLIYNNNRYISKVEHDRFFTDECLTEYSLQGLTSIVEDNGGSVMQQIDHASSIYQAEYYVNIDGIEVYEEYAHYIFDYLLHSPAISYVGFEIRRPTEDFLSGKSYILTSNNFEDYYDLYSDDNDIYYTFYYLPTLISEHKRGDRVDFKFIRLHYQKKIESWVIIDKTDVKTNFQMSIGTGSEKFLFEDYFTLEKIDITSENFSQYFHIWIEDDNRYYLYPEAFFFKAYLTVTIEISKDDFFETNSTITRSCYPYSYIELSTVLYEYDSESGTITYLYDIIAEGYIYRCQNIETSA